VTRGRLVAVIAGASVVGVVAASLIGAKSETLGLVLTAVFGSLGLSPIIKDHVRPRARKQAKPPATMTLGIAGIDLYWAPAAVIVAIAAALQVTERVTAAFVAYAASRGLAAVGLPADDPILIVAAVTGAGLVALMVQATLIVAVAYWASHRLERRSWLWIGLAIVLSQAVSLIVYQLLVGYGSAAEAAMHAASVLTLAPGAAFGIWLGERSKLDYGMSLIYGRLAQRDQLDLLEMARHAGEAAGPRT